MGAGRSLRIVGGGLATALVTGLVAERRIVLKRRRATRRTDALGSLRGTASTVTTSDGLSLHAEVDEVSPYSTPPIGEPPVTLVFSHGYCLNLDCWHLQRQAFRGKYRMAFYDQRSHGRSQRSEHQHATIDQLGRDLRDVIGALAPTGPLVLVGHSMGGMSIMALAEQHPEVFERVVGVALLATTAGDLHPHKILSRLIPNALGDVVMPRIVASLAKAPDLVDSARDGSNIGFLAADLFAFGGDVPDEYVEFVDEMIAGTPFQVIAEFFPGFRAHDKYGALPALAGVPTVIVGGGRDRLTSIEHSWRLAKELPSATYLELPKAGHMVILEAPAKVNAAIEGLVPQEARR